MSSELFRKYYTRLKSEGILKASLCGLTIGFSASAVLATLFWFMGWENFWISVIVCAVLATGSGFALYKWKFQPTTKAIARRVDELGLEERVITMTELEGDDSYIAMRQREDTLKALSSVQASFIKLVVSAQVIIGIALSSFFGISMVTVSALGEAGILPSGLELLEKSQAAGSISYCEVVYQIQEGEGTIIYAKDMTYEEEVEEEETEGEQEETEDEEEEKVEVKLSETIQKGGDALAVVAIPEKDWVFISWSDGLQNPYRQDTNVQFDLTIKAIFLPIGEALDGEEDAEKDEQPDGEPNPDAPKEERPVPMPDSAKQYEEANQYWDGNTYYGKDYADAAEDIRDELATGEYSEEQKDMVGGYLDGIETVTKKEEE